MSEENKDKQPFNQYTLKQIEEQKLKVKIIEDTIKDLKTNPEYKDYFSSYTPESVEGFINRYAMRKSDFVTYGPNYKMLYRHKCEQYIKEAKDYLPMIQQDKLLRLQYEWNEGNITIEGIESNFDFYPFYEDIFNCKFLPKITKEEVDSMSEFIRLNNKPYYLTFYTPNNYVNGFVYLQDDDVDWEYHQLPPYHQYKRNITGEKPLSKESLIKAKKEEDYITKHHEELRRANPERYDRIYPVEERPMISNWRFEDVQKFIKKFEDQKSLLKYEAWYNAIHSEDDIDEKVKTAIWHLQETDENHSLEANDDWRQAILDAAEKSKKEKTAHALYLAYEEYLQSLKDTIPFMPITAQQIQSNEIWQKYKANVLHGREVCGEPRDFNF